MVDALRVFVFVVRDHDKCLVGLFHIPVDDAAGEFPPSVVQPVERFVEDGDGVSFG